VLGYRVKLVLENTADINGGTPWIELDSHTFAIYSDDTDEEVGLSSISAREAGTRRFKAMIEQEERQTVHGDPSLRRY
jgi:hypothetical protein